MSTAEKPSLHEMIAAMRTLATPVIEKKGGTSVTFPQEFTFILSMERLDRGLESMDELIPKGLQRHEHAIGLISRTILTDFITLAFVVNFSNIEEVESTLYQIYWSDKELVDKHMKRFSDAGVLSIEEHEQYIACENQEGSFQHRVNEYYLNNEPKRFPAFAHILDKVFRDRPMKPLAFEIRNAYDQWFLLSKYEHMGWHSFALSRTLDVKDVEARVRRALYYSLLLLQICLEMLEENDLNAKAGLLFKEWMNANAFR